MKKCINYKLILYLLPMVFLLSVGVISIIIAPLHFVFYIFLIIFPVICIFAFLLSEPIYYIMDKYKVSIKYANRKKTYLWNNFKYITLLYDYHSFTIFAIKEYQLVFRESKGKERVVIAKTKKAKKLLEEYSGLRIEE